VKLLTATDDLVIGGHARAGFPLLFWDTMEFCVQADDFFRYYLLRAEIASRKSWESTGRALYDYFSFLQAHDLDWRDVERGEAKALVAGYRDYCLEISELSPNTVRQRLLYVCEFLRVRERRRLDQSTAIRLRVPSCVSAWWLSRTR